MNRWFLVVACLALVFSDSIARAAETAPRRAAMVRGYPETSTPMLTYALEKQWVAVDDYERQWLPTERYSEYDMVVLSGDMPRAKMDPSAFSDDDLDRVQAFLTNGGRLVLLHNHARRVFNATDKGKAMLARISGAEPGRVVTPLAIREPGHAWVAHLDATREYAWITGRSASPLPVGPGNPNGVNIIGNAQGSFSILARLPVGKGELIYIGWEPGAFLLRTRAQLATLEEEEAWESQMHVLMRLAADLFPTTGHRATCE